MVVLAKAKIENDPFLEEVAKENLLKELDELTSEY
jgi:hypothetical protein